MSVIATNPLETQRIEGAPHRASVSVILNHSAPGEGPRLHRHSYDETFVVQQGSVSFELGEALYSTGPGDVVIAPAGVPHKFTNVGDEDASLVCIHANPTIVGEWLE